MTANIIFEFPCAPIAKENIHDFPKRGKNKETDYRSQKKCQICHHCLRNTLTVALIWILSFTVKIM